MEDTGTAETTTTETEPASTNAIPKFCPICATLMTQQTVGDALCWVCPSCGFTIPV